MYAVGVLDHNQRFSSRSLRSNASTRNWPYDQRFYGVQRTSPRDSSINNYTGVIKVEKNANGTNAYQANRNLVLSKRSSCDTQGDPRD